MIRPQIERRPTPAQDAAWTALWAILLAPPARDRSKTKRDPASVAADRGESHREVETNGYTHSTRN